MASPRKYATRQADSSVSAPVQYAAAISPEECPTTDLGVMPHDLRRSTSAICSAVHIGCERSGL